MTSVQEKDVTPEINRLGTILAKIDELDLKDESGEQFIANTLLEVKKIEKAAKEELDSIVDPLKETIKIIQGKYKPLLDKATIIKDAIKDKVARFRADQAAAIAKQAASDAARVEKGTMKQETAERRASVVVAPANSIAGVHKARIQKLKIIDPMLIPREYLVVNETAVRNALKANIAVPGAELVYEEVMRA